MRSSSNKYHPVHAFRYPKNDYFGDVEIAKHQKYQPIAIRAENISLSTSKRHPLLVWKWGSEVQLYSNLNFEIPFGKLFGIVGNDVSVSSALIHTLACKLPGVNKNASLSTLSASETRNGVRFTHSGSVYYNEKFPTREALSKIDFVAKDNHFHPYLTVRETICHFAKIQEPHLDDEDINEKVVNIITEVGLANCSALPIGSDSTGISTEHKIRLRIALQMLNNPSVLFLDDPFNSLDDTACTDLVTLFAEICSRGPTVVFTLPASKTQHTLKLHEILVLNDGGECVYLGHAGDELERYLTGAGNIVEPGTNPLDKLLQLAHVEYNQQSQTLINQMKNHQPVARSHHGSTQKLPPELMEDIDPNMFHTPPSFSSQFFPLLRQNMRNTFRHRKLYPDFSKFIPLISFTTHTITFYCLMTIAIALLPPIVFDKIAVGSTQAWDTLGFCLFLSGIHPYIIQVINLYKITDEIEPILQEYATSKRARYFSCVVLARVVVQFILDLAAASLFATIAYWVSKARSDVYDVNNFFEFAGVSILVHFCSVSWAFLLGSIFGSKFLRAMSVISLLAALGFVLSGFNISPTLFPEYLKHWLPYVPYYSFGYELFMIVADNLRPLQSQGIGDLLMKMPFPEYPTITRAGVLVIYTIVNHILAGVLLYQLYRVSHSKHFTPTRRVVSGKSANYNSFINERVEVPAKVCLGLMEITAKLNSVELLSGVSGIFRSGELVLALGDKASGLPVLLEVIAGRFTESLGSVSELTGQIHINNCQPHTQFLQRLVGYVHSGGMAWGKLTAKETIRYYATIKMSRSVPVSEKMERADTLLREFGFADKLYTPSSALTAEFKLRLSIAIQMLNNPLIVIVDDQLKDLDFTATKETLELLKKIALQGRIVICSESRAQAWMLTVADTIMLMSLGGVAYHAKSARVMKHFKKAGHEVPPFTDAFHHILSLLRVEARTPSQEVDAKNRIRAIKEKWNPSSLEEVVEMQKLQFPKIQMMTNVLWYERLKALIKRMITQRLRHKYSLMLYIMQPLIFTGLVSFFYSDAAPHNLWAIQSRIGVINSLNLVIVFGFLQGFIFYPMENDMFIKEHRDSYVSPKAFYFVYYFCDSLINLVTSVLVALLFLFGNHMTSIPKIYFTAMFVFMLLFTSGHAFYIIITSLTSSIESSVGIFAVGLSIAITCSTFLSSELFSALAYFRYISILTHFSITSLLHEFKHLNNFVCTGPHLLLIPGCNSTDSGTGKVDGLAVINAFNLPESSQQSMYVGLAFACAIVYQLIAFICFAKLQRSLTKR